MSGFWKSKRAPGRMCAAMALAVLLSACGGGGGNSGSPVVGGDGGGSTPIAVASLSVAPSLASLPNDGTQTSTITVTALDANNVAIKNVAVTFAADSGTISPLATATDDKGEIKATLGIGDNKTKRTITVTAKAGSASKAATVAVVESTTSQPVASDASVILSKASVTNTGSDSVEATVTAVDAARNAVAGLPVKFSSDDNSALIVATNTSTDANGQARATIRIGANRNNRTVNVVAEVGTLSRQTVFRVTGAKLSASLAQNSLTAGQPGTVEYTLLDSGGNPIEGSTITVSGPGGATGSGATNFQGKYTYSFTAAGSGSTLISAVAPGDVRVESNIQINTPVSDVPAGTTIASATFTAAPAVVNVNQPGSTANRSELRLLFRNDQNLPVPNVRVRLGLGGNASGTDGVVGTGNDKVIVADPNGVAASSFVPGLRSSPVGGVKVYACFGKTDAVEQIAACPAGNLKEISLTVVEEPVSISIGTNNKLVVNTHTYAQDFVVLVVDSANNPKADVQLSAVLDLPTYLKGFWTRVGLRWMQTVNTLCINEDNKGGVRSTVMESGEDLNGNGQLDPRQSDISVSFVGLARTDSNGQAVVRIEYPQSMGSWVEYRIQVSATGVVSPPAWMGRFAAPGVPAASLEGTARILGVPTEAVAAEGEPPFRLSPYGQNSSCTSAN
ncbi:hypothetical protein G8A07_06055 [Roseateles sp. DAIF2]|uniref:Ig-like domain-containing protein n=1 Tax=Roseateles sp. DAIF2 TaxID=2714952 RepID=UPI0018A321C0|nr:Ig-like domain-containing protein [Roseateles sp. DAIF2]QPF72538.1 hypothetical protein G8A07_06055 [Roseateles sp. DAIF2]